MDNTTPPNPEENPSSANSKTSKKSTGKRFDTLTPLPGSPVTGRRRCTSSHSSSIAKVRTSLFGVPENDKVHILAKKIKLECGENKDCILNLKCLTSGVQSCLQCSLCQSNNVEVKERHTTGISSVVEIVCNHCYKQKERGEDVAIVASPYILLV